MNEDEKAVLVVFAQDYEEKGKVANFDLEEASQHATMEKKRTERAIKSLIALGYLDYFSFGGEFTITDAGYRAFRGMNAIPAAGGVNIINISGGAHGTAIAVGGSQATVSNNGATFFIELQKQIEATSLPEEEKKGLLQSLKKLAGHPLVTTLAGDLLKTYLGS